MSADMGQLAILSGGNVNVTGDQVHFEVLDQSFLVLRSLTRTNDIFEKLEKRSSFYSSRIQNLKVPMLINLQVIYTRSEAMIILQ